MLPKRKSMGERAVKSAWCGISGDAQSGEALDVGGWVCQPQVGMAVGSDVSESHSLAGILSAQEGHIEVVVRI